MNVNIFGNITDIDLSLIPTKAVIDLVEVAISHNIRTKPYLCCAGLAEYYGTTVISNVVDYLLISRVSRDKMSLRSIYQIISAGCTSSAIPPFYLKCYWDEMWLISAELLQTLLYL